MEVEVAFFFSEKRFKVEKGILTIPEKRFMEAEITFICSLKRFIVDKGKLLVRVGHKTNRVRFANRVGGRDSQLPAKYDMCLFSKRG